MAKKAFVMLAHSYEDKHRIAGMWASEKLDGIRMIWDGGITRGLPASEVPWANIEKHGRFKEPPQATGLWSRYAHPINAPASFLNSLPKLCLDGEAWAGRGRFQEVSSIIRSSVNTADWSPITYKVFDAPSIYDLFEDREIDDTNIHITMKGCGDWVWSRARKLNWDHDAYLHQSMTFEETLEFLSWFIFQSPVSIHLQKRLAAIEMMAQEEGQRMAESIKKGGGEGIILRHALSKWQPERSWDMLKLKPYKDAEATVIGYTWGKRTNKGSKLLGMMGSARLDWDGVIFDMAGFTNAEREMTYPDGSQATAEGMSHPGEQVSEGIHNPRFPRGTRITFRYRETTNDGKPKEASFMRVRDERD